LLAILLKPQSPDERTADEHATVGTVMPAEPGPASGIGTHAAGPGTSNKGPLTDVELEPSKPAVIANAMPPGRVSPPVPQGYSPGPGTVVGDAMPSAPSSKASSPVARGASVVGSAIGAIGRVIGSLFKHNGKVAPGDGNHRPVSDPVDCTVFAPAWVEPGSTALVQVAVHLEGAAGKVALMAKEFDATSERRGVKRLETEIARGSRLLFQLSVPGLTVDDPLQSAVWRGEPEMLQFGVSAPADANERSVVGALLVSIDGVPCGRVKFTLRVVRSQSGTQPAPEQHRLARYRKVFVSYSSADRNEVLKRVQMLRQMQVDVFQDVLSLEPGQRWQRELYRRIDDSDLFLLFWSSSAKASEWVTKEVLYALNRQRHNGSDLPDIVPVILEGPPIPSPPPELAHLHFNDQILNHLKQGAA
jgi:hypothetical protein